MVEEVFQISEEVLKDHVIGTVIREKITGDIVRVVKD